MTFLAGLWIGGSVGLVVGVIWDAYGALREKARIDEERAELMWRRVREQIMEDLAPREPRCFIAHGRAYLVPVEEQDYE